MKVLANQTEKKLIDFWAPWCGPCKGVGLSLEKLETESEIKIEKINIDENRDMATKYGIMSIPTLILVENGEEKERIVGSLPYSKLKKWVDNFISDLNSKEE